MSSPTPRQKSAPPPGAKVTQSTGESAAQNPSEKPVEPDKQVEQSAVSEQVRNPADENPDPVIDVNTIDEPVVPDPDFPNTLYPVAGMTIPGRGQVYAAPTTKYGANGVAVIMFVPDDPDVPVSSIMTMSNTSVGMINNPDGSRTHCKLKQTIMGG